MSPLIRDLHSYIIIEPGSLSQMVSEVPTATVRGESWQDRSPSWWHFYSLPIHLGQTVKERHCKKDALKRINGIALFDTKNQPFIIIFLSLCKKQGKKATPKSHRLLRNQSPDNKYYKYFQEPLTAPTPNGLGKAPDIFFCCLIWIMQCRFMTNHKRAMLWDDQMVFYQDISENYRESWLGNLVFIWC